MKPILLILITLLVWRPNYLQADGGKLAKGGKIASGGAASGGSATIAVDATAGNSTFGCADTQSWSHTISGSNRLLIVGFRSSTDVVTAVNWNTSEALTLIDKQTISGTVTQYSYRLINPSTGTHNISVSLTGAPNCVWISTSYTGTKQSGQPDAHTTGSGANEADTTVSLTTVADNSWMIVIGNDTNDNTLTAGSGSTQREGTTTYFKMFDSNGPITPAGSHNMTISHTNSNLKSLMLSIAPL